MDSGGLSRSRSSQRHPPYVLVSQHSIEVEVYRRQSAGLWTVEMLKTDQDFHLESVDLKLTMAEIYEDVRW